MPHDVMLPEGLRSTIHMSKSVSNTAYNLRTPSHSVSVGIWSCFTPELEGTSGHVCLCSLQQADPCSALHQLWEKPRWELEVRRIMAKEHFAEGILESNEDSSAMEKSNSFYII